MPRLREPELRSLLTNLPFVGLRAFIAACATRQLGAYAYFQKETGASGLEVLRNALDNVWSHIDDGELDPSSLMGECEQLFENESDSWELHRAWAESSVLSIVAALRSFVESPLDIAVETAIYGQDALDLRIIYVLGLDMSDRGNEAKVDAHPTMVKEVEREQRDIGEIRANLNVGSHWQPFIQELRRRAEAESNDFLR